MRSPMSSMAEGLPPVIEISALVCDLFKALEDLFTSLILES